MTELDPKGVDAAIAAAESAFDVLAEDPTIKRYGVPSAFHPTVFSAAITAYLSVSPLSGDGWQAIETAAAKDVLAERDRQKTAEGWTCEHDDFHSAGEICYAAMAYISNSAVASQMLLSGMTPENVAERAASCPVTDLWPWDSKWWKPTSQRRDLVKAGALILAEIERLDRLKSPTDEVK